MKPITIIAIVLVCVLALFGIAMYGYGAYVKSEVQQSVNTNLIRPDAFVLGNPDAKVTVVEFFDPACSACVRIAPMISRLPDRFEGKVKVVYRGIGYHQGSDVVLSLLEAAKEQGRYKQLWEAFIRSYTRWFNGQSVNAFVAWGVLGEAGVDEEAAKQYLDNNKAKVDATLKQALDDSQSLRITATPTFFVNSVQVKADSLLPTIEAEIAKLYN
jgi:protein-disulfide isomerase